METRVIRSARKSLALELTDRDLLVRAPLWVTKKQIDAFLAQHRRWIEKALARREARRREAAALTPLTAEELDELVRRAKAYIPQRVAHFAPLVGVDYGHVTIRCQKTRWGSCSAKGDLSFNCLLMLAPADVLDSVVVHELCHRREMNHSERFYHEVLRVFPDYRACRRWLTDHGHALLVRAAARTATGGQGT